MLIKFLSSECSRNAREGTALITKSDFFSENNCPVCKEFDLILVVQMQDVSTTKQTSFFLGPF